MVLEYRVNNEWKNLVKKTYGKTMDEMGRYYGVPFCC
jgi:hypothetical protein